MKMKKILKNCLLAAVVLLALASCDYVIPEKAFGGLVDADVLQHLSFLDTDVDQKSALSFKAEISEELLANEKISFKWEIRNTRGDVVKESRDNPFELKEGLNSEEYEIFFVLVHENGEKRAFGRSFNVKFMEISSEIVLTGLKAADDTGSSDTDGVTRINNNLTVNGYATSSTELTVKIESADGGYSAQFPSTSDANGDFSVLITDAVNPLADGQYNVTFFENSNPELFSRILKLQIDTQKPVIEWKNAGPAGGLNWGDAVDSFGKVTSVETLSTYNFSGNIPGVEQERNFNSNIAGTQTLVVTGSDAAGNVSEAITRDVTVSAPVLQELVVNGDINPAPETAQYDFQPVWKQMGQGFKYGKTKLIGGTEMNQWGGVIFSDNGAWLQYDSDPDGYNRGISWVDNTNGNHHITFNSAKVIDTNPEYGFYRFKGTVYQTIAVERNVTYRFTARSQFSNTNHDCWNSIAVRSADRTLNFIEGNILNNDKEPIFDGGDAIRVNRVPHSGGIEGTWVNMSVDFTPDKDGLVIVGVIKSDLTNSNPPQTGYSYFDDLSVIGVDWVKIP